jgi:hypothetical protein
MKIGVIGAGHIGGNCARQAVKAGHEVILSFTRDPARLARLASELGDRASTGRAAAAVAFGEAVILSVPWGAIPDALAQAGDLSGKVVIDTTNQFGAGPKPRPGQTAASFNTQRMAGGRYVKSFNTLTAHFQQEAAEREGTDRVVQWMCGDDAEAKLLVTKLIREMGYVPVDLGGTEGCQVMEAPRRPGAVYARSIAPPTPKPWSMPCATASPSRQHQAIKQHHVIRDTVLCMTMLSFRVPDEDAAEVQRWAAVLGIDRSEILRDALHRHLVMLKGEADAQLWEEQPATEAERSLEAIADWGPAEDWADWADAEG